MRTTRVLSISMPPEMLREAERLAREENRTISELVREALRCYRQDRQWQQTLAYGRARARALGIRESDVVPLIHEFRRSRRRKVAARDAAK
jgi:CopG family transcriptional regulator/antitoxin EndoAI